MKNTVYDVADVTPLSKSRNLSKKLGFDIYLKREDLQSVHSFKLRGAYNKIFHLTPEEKSRGIIAASAGNHAQGVALSAKKLGLSAVIVMPKYLERLHHFVKMACILKLTTTYRNMMNKNTNAFA